MWTHISLGTVCILQSGDYVSQHTQFLHFDWSRLPLYHVICEAARDLHEITGNDVQLEPAGLVLIKHRRSVLFLCK